MTEGVGHTAEECDDVDCRAHRTGRSHHDWSPKEKEVFVVKERGKIVQPKDISMTEAGALIRYERMLENATGFQKDRIAVYRGRLIMEEEMRVKPKQGPVLIAQEGPVTGTHGHRFWMGPSEEGTYLHAHDGGQHPHQHDEVGADLEWQEIKDAR